MKVILKIRASNDDTQKYLSIAQREVKSTSWRNILSGSQKLNVTCLSAKGVSDGEGREGTRRLLLGRYI